MTTLSDIQTFLTEEKLIVAGVSSNPKKFGNQITKSLVENSFTLSLVNPNAEEILGMKVFSKVNEVPKDFTSLYIVTPKSQTDAIIKEAARMGIMNIWVQQNSETSNTKNIADELGIQLIYKKCLFMYINPVKGIHKFHSSLAKLFGTYPK